MLQRLLSTLNLVSLCGLLEWGLHVHKVMTIPFHQVPARSWARQRRHLAQITTRQLPVPSEARVRPHEADGHAKNIPAAALISAIPRRHRSQDVSGTVARTGGQSSIVHPHSSMTCPREYLNSAGENSVQPLDGGVINVWRPPFVGYY
jgi:hypothetical protein